MVLDLGGVSFLDSTAMGTLLRAQRDARARDVRLCLANPSPACLRLLIQTGLLRSFTVFDTAAEALQECAGSTPTQDT